jgi:tRNA-splicing ligase RtcB
MKKLDKCELLIPLEEIEHEAQNQLFYFLEKDFCKKAAVCPDIHPGVVMPVGCVVLLDNVICPPAVGSDIGCGVSHINTKIDYSKIKGKEKKIYKDILNRIPVGIGARSEIKNSLVFKSATGLKDFDVRVNAKLQSQLGTLGGGNHFIEIGINKSNEIGITLHSGSRNPGKVVGEFYSRMICLNVDRHLPKEFLDMNSQHGKQYLEDMNFMLDYALLNRKMMMEDILDILNFDSNLIKTMINENHNHAIVTPDGILHRKGATPADLGQYGIIPGNMRDGCYITRGLGNEKYLSSASHGAGRKGSRSWAKKKFTLEQFEKDMKGIVSKIDKNILDENPRAYKDFNKVIERQKGIVVDIVDFFKPIINIKG